MTPPSSDSVRRPLPEPDHVVATLGVSVAVAARQLGVAPGTLRTWERRYGLGPSAHTAGSHRRYTPVDLERLSIMRRLSLSGVAPAEAAQAALAARVDALPWEHSFEAVVPPDADDVVADADSGPRVPREPRERTAEVVHLTARIVPPTPAEVVRAASMGDAHTSHALLGIPLGADIVTWWEALAFPALEQVVDTAGVTQPGVDPLSVVASSVIDSVRDYVERRCAQEPGIVRRHPSRSGKTVLVVAPDGPVARCRAHAICAALIDRGVSAHVLIQGADTDALGGVVSKIRPVAVVIVAARGADADALVGDLTALEPAPAVVIGPYPHSAPRLGAPGGARGVQWLRSFGALVHEVAAIAVS